MMSPPLGCFPLAKGLRGGLPGPRVMHTIFLHPKGSSRGSAGRPRLCVGDCACTPLAAQAPEGT